MIALFGQQCSRTMIWYNQLHASQECCNLWKHVHLYFHSKPIPRSLIYFQYPEHIFLLCKDNHWLDEKFPFCNHFHLFYYFQSHPRLLIRWKCLESIIPSCKDNIFIISPRLIYAINSSCYQYSWDFASSRCGLYKPDATFSTLSCWLKYFFAFGGDSSTSISYLLLKIFSYWVYEKSKSCTWISIFPFSDSTRWFDSEKKKINLWLNSSSKIHFHASSLDRLGRNLHQNHQQLGYKEMFTLFLRHSRC